MEDKITATKIPQPDFVPEAINAQYEVLIEETRKDDVGNEYKFTRKELINKSSLDMQIAQIEEDIARLRKMKNKLEAKKLKLV